MGRVMWGKRVVGLLLMGGPILFGMFWGALYDRSAPAPTPGPSIMTLRAALPEPSPVSVLERAVAPPGGAAPEKRPTLDDFWEGRAEFVVDVPETGLPMGESDTVVLPGGEMWSYLHASAASAGTIDQCGDPVPFPGCTVIYRSVDGGQHFEPQEPPVCQFACIRCPCEAERDHHIQQQYPRVAISGDMWLVVYEHLGRAIIRVSRDGLVWSAPAGVSISGHWLPALPACRPEERIGPHPFVPYEYECLIGGPPGIYVEGEQVYVFLGLGQNPGGLGCYTGTLAMSLGEFRRCSHNPLLKGASIYGPLDEKGPVTNPYFDFRMLSSAEVVRVGERYYMFYEGVRGPGPGDPGDTQFGLGLARSQTAAIDGPWELFPGNPILVEMPGNIGVGHADVVIVEGGTYLYTSMDGQKRSRLALQWR